MRIVLVALLMIGCKDESATTSRAKAEAEAAGEAAAKKVEESKAAVKQLHKEVAEIDDLVRSAEAGVSAAQSDAERASANAKLDALRGSKRKLTNQIKELEQETENLVSGGTDASRAIARMEGFSNQMCQCRDRACVDGVNEAMTRWGTEMAKRARPPRDERPDPELAKRSADIMTRYTECMTKVMMAGAGPAEAPQ